MNDRFPRSTRRAWCLALIHHHRNLAAKVLFIEAECLVASPGATDRQAISSATRTGVVD
jgi:hypothetical protein